MFKLILGLVISAAAGAAVTAGVRLIRRMVGSQDRLAWAPYAAVAGAALLALLGLGLLAGTSFTIIDADEVGHLQRVYGGSSMPPGQVIAFRGQAGPQADVLSPGFKFKPLLNVLYRVEKHPVLEIPADSYGFLVAQDGEPLRPGQVLADPWPQGRFSRMLDAEYFLRNGGQKGPQLSVLAPGKWRINRYLFAAEIRPATNIQLGTVGVVKSNVQEMDVCKPLSSPQEDSLTVPLVPKGCIGVWSEALLPGRYYLNHRAYEVTPISTRAHSWQYSGGFQRRVINLVVDQEGRITQNESTQAVPVPEAAVESAIHVRVAGWSVPVGVRVIVQVSAEDAPFVVASVGGLTEVEDRFLTPTLRSVVRNVVGQKGRRVLELQDQRAELESLVEKAMVLEGRKAGLSIKEVRFGDLVIPAELLVALIRRHLGAELEKTYAQERQAQEQRILTEQSRATADQQDRLVTAQIGVQVEQQNKQASKLRGEGREAELTAIARGQQVQAEVLGEERVLQLEALSKVLEAATLNPDIVKVPTIMVQGTATGLEGFAAILGGASNLAQGSLFQKEQEPGTRPLAEEQDQ